MLLIKTHSFDIICLCIWEDLLSIKSVVSILVSNLGLVICYSVAVFIAFPQFLQANA
jgi:hypothetical protein